MIKKITSKLLLAAIALGFSLNANAQFKGQTEQYPTKNYSTTTIEFKLSEVATAAGYSTVADFVTAYEKASAEWSLAQETAGAIPETWVTDTTTMYYTIPDTLGNTSTTYSQGSFGGIWMTADGKMTSWGANSYFFEYVEMDDEADMFSFNVGQYPNVCEANNTYSTTITLVSGTNNVTFDLSLSIKETEELPEPTEVLSGLEIVGTTTLSYEQYPAITWTAEAQNILIQDIADALGCSTGTITSNISSVFYTYQLDEVMDVIKDSLTNVSTANEPGFWFTQSIDPTTGEDSPLCYAVGYGNTDKFYVEMSENNDSIAFSLGQYPENCAVGDHYYTDIYIIYGSKAYKVILDLNVVKRPEFGGDYENVGSLDINVNVEPANSYSGTTYTLDLESIAEALGCSVSEMTFANNTSDDHSTSYTTSGVGFWMLIDGTVCAWANSASAVYIDYEEDNSQLVIGQYPGRNSDGDVFTGILEFLNMTDGKSYTLNVTVNFKTAEIGAEFTNLKTYDISVQCIQNDDYTPYTSEALDMETILAVLETSSPVSYGLEVLDEGEETTNPMYDAANGVFYTKEYTCTPHPGFWVNENGYNIGWGSSAKIGATFTLSDGTFDIYQMPGYTTVGDTYETKWFLVNTENGNMVTINIEAIIVDTIIDIEVVGEEKIAIDLGTDTEDAEGEAVVDITAMLEALGEEGTPLTAEEFLNNGGIILTSVSSNKLGGASYYDEAEGFWYDKNGYVLDMSNEEDINKQAFSLLAEVESGSTEVTIKAYALEAPAEGDSLYTMIAFQYNGKQYIYDITLMSSSTITSISNVATGDVLTGNVYDVNGRLVRKNAVSAEGLKPGVYVINKQKVLVK